MPTAKVGVCLCLRLFRFRACAHAHAGAQTVRVQRRCAKWVKSRQIALPANPTWRLGPVSIDVV